MEMRQDLADAHDRALERIASPGTWWTGAQRTALAQEARVASKCELCINRKKALTPYAVSGDHTRPAVRAEELSEGAVDAVHRLVTDPSRLSRRWLDEHLAGEAFSIEQYVELIGVVTQIVSVDAVYWGLGLPTPELVEPRAGEPSRRRPTGAAMEEAWVPMVKRENLDPEDRGLFGEQKRTGNVLRALSLVPEEVRALLDLSAAQYLSPTQMMRFGTKFRSLNRAQIELIAGRVSALNECFY